MPVAIVDAEPVVPPEPLPPPLPDRRKKDDDITAEDAAKREKVRAAARERQRKHRALVKQRKMRELGLDMGNDVVMGVEEMQFRLDENGVYQQIMPHEVPHHHHPPHTTLIGLIATADPLIYLGHWSSFWLTLV